jgi:hypothetical protein
MSTEIGFLRCVVERLFGIIPWAIGLSVVAFAWLGVGPQQAERPPQPFFQDFFSGSVLLQGSPPPEGTLLIACIDGCDNGFESAAYNLDADGTFDQLEVDPDNEDLVGHLISFYLENEFGRIQAVETRPYIGVFDFYVQNLTFVDPMPIPRPTPLPNPPTPTLRPTPTASLPIAGDPSVALLPKIAVVTGIVISLVGGSMVLVARRPRP